MHYETLKIQKDTSIIATIDLQVSRLKPSNLNSENTQAILKRAIEKNLKNMIDIRLHCKLQHGGL